MQTESKLSMLFVGCGGTFYCMVPYLAVLLRRFKPRFTVFIDPDRLTEGNLTRQWSNLRASDIDRLKAGLATGSLGEAISLGRFATDDELFNTRRTYGIEDGLPAIVVANPDNNQCRLDCRAWAAQRRGLTAMVVSGCDGTKGQAYWGAWYDGQPLHDWLAEHPDVAEETDGEPHQGCGGQTIFSNAMTAQLVGRCIEDVVDWMGPAADNGERPGPCAPTEYYWELEKGRLRAYSRRITKPLLEGVIA